MQNNIICLLSLDLMSAPLNTVSSFDEWPCHHSPWCVFVLFLLIYKLSFYVLTGFVMLNYLFALWAVYVVDSWLVIYLLLCLRSIVLILQGCLFLHLIQLYLMNPLWFQLAEFISSSTSLSFILFLIDKAFTIKDRLLIIKIMRSWINTFFIKIIWGILTALWIFYVYCLI